MTLLLPGIGVKKGAIISMCEKYRYRLWRIWNDSEPPLVWVMLNPSTANADEDDPTIRRCVGYAEHFGFGGIEVINLWAYRTSRPKELIGLPTRIMIESPDEPNRWLMTALEALRWNEWTTPVSVVAAWGANGAKYEERVKQISRILQNYAWHHWCIGMTKGGHPRHPLDVRGNQELIAWPVKENRA